MMASLTERIPMKSNGVDQMEEISLKVLHNNRVIMVICTTKITSSSDNDVAKG